MFVLNAILLSSPIIHSPQNIRVYLCSLTPADNFFPRRSYIPAQAITHGHAKANMAQFCIIVICGTRKNKKK